jgi:hypothetical protein
MRINNIRLSMGSTSCAYSAAKEVRGIKTQQHSEEIIPLELSSA